MQTKDLLDCSQDVLRAEKALEVQYEEYYEQLADQQSLSPEEQAALRSDVTREVREHNNFARRVPILEEQMKVANHRIADLEQNEKVRN